jgi:hypothetical protein
MLIRNYLGRRSAAINGDHASQAAIRDTTGILAGACRLLGLLESGRRLRGEPMFVIGAEAVVEDRVQGGEVFRVRAEPRIDVVGLDRNDASVVAGSRDFRRRSSVITTNDSRSGSLLRPRQCDHRQATSMSCGSDGRNSSTTLSSFSPGASSRLSALCRLTFS